MMLQRGLSFRLPVMRQSKQKDDAKYALHGGLGSANVKEALRRSELCSGTMASFESG